MAVIGLSKPYYATYTNSGTTVTYGGASSLGKACEIGISIDEADPTILYADNGPAETASGFSGGTLTLQIDELSIGVAGAIMGVVPTSSTTPSGSNNVITLGGTAAAPYLGFGIVVKKQVSNSYKWLAIILHKIQFQVPDMNATTQGDSIEFQTPELSATILRDDTTSNNWCTQGQFDTEENAVSFITNFLAAPTTNGAGGGG